MLFRRSRKTPAFANQHEHTGLRDYDDFMGVDNAGHYQSSVGTMTSISATAPVRSRARAGAGHGGDSQNNDGVCKTASSGKRGKDRPRGARKNDHREAPDYASME